MIVRTLQIIALAVLATVAHAQTPGPSAAVAMPQVPPNPCVKPELPGKSATDAQIKTFNRDYNAYADCVRQYVTDVQNLIKTADTAAQKAVDEYNGFNRALKAEQDKAKE